MSPIAENPVVVPDREADEERKSSESEPPRIRSLFAAGRPPKTTCGLKPSAFLAVDGRCTRSGTRNDGISLLDTRKLRIK